MRRFPDDESTGLFVSPPHPFGGVHTSTGAPPSARFPGQWFQSESGLHQNWMRDYDPTTGRYLQADPLGLIDGASVYGYAGQSPMMNMDPTGQCFGPAIALALACAAGAAALYIYRKLILKAAIYCGELIWEEFWIWYNTPDSGNGDEAGDCAGASLGAGAGPEGASGQTSTTKKGREKHKEQQYPEGFHKEEKLPSGKQPDALSLE